ncbi:MAG: hypothetical protein PS018_00810 [bacterium]|nr:hypothetical protein [bacterium]
MSNKVVADHETIFGPDPFLMDDEAQIRYREAIIRHLLVFRSSRSTHSYDLDLHNPNSVDGFFARPGAPANPPSPDVIVRYDEARTARAAVQSRDFAVLKNFTMVSDSSLTERRRIPDGYASHPGAIKELDARREAAQDAEKGGIATFDRRLRIAVIGYRVKISTMLDKGQLDEELSIFRPPATASDTERETVANLPETGWLEQLGRTRCSEARSLADWKEAICTHIRRAFQRRSHIVMLPEFALPPLEGTEEKNIEDDVLSVSQGNETPDHFLVAGTRHQGSVNHALVISKRGGEVSKPFWHLKVASARGMGENILGPRGKNFPNYTVQFDIPDRGTFVATVMVAICYDAFDPTTFLKLCRQGALTFQKNKSQHLIILVPSFNNSRDFVALLRDLSFITRSLVVYGDGLNGDAKLFFCGIALSDLYEKKAVMERKLAESIKDLTGKYARYRESRRATARRKQPTAEQTRDAAAKMRHKRDISSVFKEQLDALRARGALDHLVTVEPIAESKPQNPALIDDDLLYYNIDINLLNVLKNFREDFFLNDDFLPRALQLDELATN